MIDKNLGFLCLYLYFMEIGYLNNVFFVLIFLKEFSKFFWFKIYLYIEKEGKYLYNKYSC